MPRACFPPDEILRLNSLMECRILDTPPEQVFDDLAKLASRLCDAPIALVSLIDADRQWFKSTVGIDAKETHRDSAFCAHAILGHEPFVVTDAAADPRTCDNPLVVGPPYIRFYTGIPLRTEDGYPLGTLCVIDTKSRDISSQQLADLQALALQVISQLSLRRLNQVLAQSQSQLQEMHNRLYEIAAQVPGVVYQFELRPDGTSCFPYASEGIREIYRVSPEEVRNDASLVFAALHPDDFDEVVASIADSAQNLTPWQQHYRVRFSDGEVRWLYGNSTPIRQENGSIVWYGFITDETENRNARDEAIVVRSLMQAVVHGSTQVAIIATDLQGTITVFNSGAERMLGYSAAEMINKQTPEIIHLRSEVEERSRQLSKYYGYPVEGFETLVHCVRLGGHVEADWTYIRKDNSDLTVRLVVTAMRDENGTVTGFIGVAADVTETRNIEKTLRFERERLDMALAGGELGTWDLNLQTGEAIWDERFASLLGERLEDLTQTFEAHSARIHPDDKELVRSSVRRHLDGLTTIYTAEYRLLQKNGDWRWIQSRGRLMQRDESGRPLRMLGTIADLSSRKMIEEQMVKAREMADMANRSKSEFLANMSHEIRTPLTSILGYADLLSIANVSAAEVADGVATIRSAGRHLLTIINDVLDLSKIEAGKMTVERISFSPLHLIREVMSVLQQSAEAKGIILNARSVGPIPRIIVSDPVRIRQILLNLVGNAVKFTEQGQVCVIVEFVPKSAGQSNGLIFEVTDTGIGMTQEQCAGLFEPFMQADASTSRQFGGTGLGLAICRRMAALLDGDIVARSERGVGSSFRVNIAIELVENIDMLDSLSLIGENPVPMETTGEEIRLSGRILLAEDNPVNRRLFEQILRNAGAIVDVAENGQVAVEKALQAMKLDSSSKEFRRGYDVILMDMQMPVLDGYGATRQLRDRGYQGPIIALTAHALDEDRRKCIETGCSDVATKPIEKTRLISVCRQAIEAQTAASGNRDKYPCSDIPATQYQVDSTALMNGLDGDFELLEELINLFQSNSSELLAEMQESLQSGDRVMLERSAHSLKGAVSNFSAAGAYEAALAMETFAKGDNLAGAARAFSLLQSELQSLMSELSGIHKCGAVVAGF